MQRAWGRVPSICNSLAIASLLTGMTLSARVENKFPTDSYFSLGMPTFACCLLDPCANMTVHASMDGIGLIMLRRMMTNWLFWSNKFKSVCTSIAGAIFLWMKAFGQNFWQSENLRQSFWQLLKKWRKASGLRQNFQQSGKTLTRLLNKITSPRAICQQFEISHNLFQF